MASGWDGRAGAVETGVAVGAAGETNFAAGVPGAATRLTAAGWAGVAGPTVCEAAGCQYDVGVPEIGVAAIGAETA